MNAMEWSKSSLGYGRKLVDSTIAGIHSGEHGFLEEGRLTPYVATATRRSLCPSAIGAIVGACCGYLATDRRSAARALGGAIVGGMAGFSAGMLWETRDLTASVGSCVRKSVQRTRDEHWFEKNPIDYA
jgi:hypothetical protein